jgi:hypothetical protein
MGLDSVAQLRGPVFPLVIFRGGLDLLASIWIGIGFGSASDVE